MIGLVVSATAQLTEQKASIAEKFIGRLDAELSPDMVHISQRVLEVQPAKVTFKPTIDKNAIVSSGEIYYPLTTSRRGQLFLIEPLKGEPFVAVDTDSNNVIDANERFSLKSSSSRPDDLHAIVRLPIKNPFYKSFPIFVMYKRGFRHPKLRPIDRLVLQSVMALAYGTVKIDGYETRFQYPFDLGSPAISTTEGLFGVDSNGDGTIRDEQFSPESSYAANAELVFPLGDIFVSTEKIDLAKNEIIVRKRNKEEYLRYDLDVGQTIADFSFVDFEGKSRSLYDFKGKYLLIDFWGAWCHDCTLETPYHVEALKRFQKRGFYILSLNTDEDIGVAKNYMEKNGMTWTQARNDSIRKLIEVTYRIQEYPSTILIGPDGKVLILDQNELRGDSLLKTLDRILP